MLGAVEVEVGMGEVAGGVRPGVNVELLVRQGLDMAAPVVPVLVSDPARGDGALTADQIVDDDLAAKDILPPRQRRLPLDPAAAVRQGPSHDHLALSVVDHLPRLQPGAAGEDDGVSPQQDGVSLDVVDEETVSGVFESVISRF